MAITNYIWDGDAVIAETDGTGDVKVSYTRQPDEYGSLISETRNGQIRYHHYDALGSTTELTDSAGEVTDTFRYSAFGNEVKRTGSTPTPYTWAGKSGYQQDGPNDFYVRRRHYVSSVGRWVSQDPIGLVSGANRYKYVDNQSMVQIDPSGLIKVTTLSNPSIIECYFEDPMGPDFQVQWDFVLDKPAPCDGYIVQENRASCYRSDCSSPCPNFSVKPCLVFYEAWFIKAGSDRTGITKNLTDVANIDINGCGSEVFLGKIKFFCKDPKHPAANGVGTGDLGKHENPTPGSGWQTKGSYPISGNCKGDSGRANSGGLPATATKPKWWDKKPVEGSAARTLSVLWNCCPCENNFVDVHVAPAFSHPK